MGFDLRIVTAEAPPSLFGAGMVSAVARSLSWGRLGRILGFCALTALAAQIRIPVPGTDVPITLQLLSVLLAGLMLPVREAASCMVLYLGLGAIGLPVFAPGSTGIAGPTGGYLVGFLPAAVLTAWIARPPAMGIVRLLSAASAGVASVLVAGVVGRILWLGGDAGSALATGLVPFLPKAVVELFLAVAIVRTADAYLKRR